MYVPPKVKPLCPSEISPRFEDVTCAKVTLNNGKENSLKLDIYQSSEQSDFGPCIIYICGGDWLRIHVIGKNSNRVTRKLIVIKVDLTQPLNHRYKHPAALL
ncbi:hypothetical protein ACQ5SI_01295 [Peribacillus frigoritolerans]|uniref:hypothetical protein n=1 Tax=Peribacillus frigoritolerans TaxID=450367 RepID=UPI003D334317